MIVAEEALVDHEVYRVHDEVLREVYNHEDEASEVQVVLVNGADGDEAKQAEAVRPLGVGLQEGLHDEERDAHLERGSSHYLDPLFNYTLWRDLLHVGGIGLEPASEEQPEASDE